MLVKYYNLARLVLSCSKYPFLNLGIDMTVVLVCTIRLDSLRLVVLAFSP